MWSTIVGTLLLLSRAAHALQNVTVDNDHESIVYCGHWASHKAHTSNLYHSDSIRLSNSSSSNVTFTFTGECQSRTCCGCIPISYTLNRSGGLLLVPQMAIQRQFARVYRLTAG